MSGSLELWTAILIAIVTIGGIARTVLRRRSADVRGPAWRFAALIALQILGGALLHPTLFPPSVATPPGRLVVATHGAKPALRASGDVLVALPEAGPLPGAVRAPDLGSALRLYPEPGRLRIEGDGLTPRDQIPLDRPAEFAPSPAPRGLIALTPPKPLAPGGCFTVAGQVGGGGGVELIDPAGAVVDQAAVAADGRFQLSAAARAPGLALFDLRLKDAAGRTVEQIEIPIETRAQRQPRVLVLAGAPSAETKYLRRWAQDAGIALNLDIDVGAGVALGDPPIPITRATLAEIDLVVVDDRRWESLSPGARTALAAATGEGLGLLLRPTGPLSAATRRDWTNMGMATSGDGEVHAFRLDGPTNLELSRYDLAQAGRDGVPMIRDKAGAPLAAWRPRGQGRVGLWIVVDSYGLALAGHTDRYGEMWSELFSILARPSDGPGVWVDGIARLGQRATLRGVRGPIRVVDPDGVESRPVVDPAAGPAARAAYWPRRAGWHRVSDGARFYVHPADAAPSLAWAADRQATLDAVAASVTRGARAIRTAPGSSWPWAAGLLAVLGLLWWLERRSRS
ncbi:hypothetical protein [Caulobacter sp. 602-1]|uniref:hypothetical protein n=1 Tax=Caulobacter sp. 602-1 TaxID=2492472 RepID=UPI000F63D488|nr:hypothetical protein [Caulobacter sp. 602-1]RRN64063.1 hypothetical protein EIK80_15020 [Caulobacter sp. 602-1]